MDQPMRKTLLLVVAPVLWCLAATVAVADQCDELAASLAIATGSTLGEREQGIYSLVNQVASEVDFGCSGPVGNQWLPYFFSAFSHDGLPRDEFFDLVGTAANVLAGVPKTNVRAIAKNCLAGAIRAQNGIFGLKTSSLAFQCSGGPSFGGLQEVSFELSP